MKKGNILNILISCIPYIYITTITHYVCILKHDTKHSGVFSLHEVSSASENTECLLKIILQVEKSFLLLYL